jgi:Spy/CpxP family protein refolding chaperone
MTRTRTLLAILAPAAFAGVIVAASASSTRADADDDRADATADRAARRAARDADKAAARAAKTHLKQARKLARQQLDQARRELETAGIPDALRDRILARLELASDAIDRRMSRAGSGNLDVMVVELEAMGREIEQEMAAMGRELEKEMEAMGAQWEAWAKQFEGAWHRFDGTGVPQPPRTVIPPMPPMPPMPPSGPIDIDIDMSDLDLSIDLGDLSLSTSQTDALHDVFADERQVVEPAREALDVLSDDLRRLLDDPDADERAVARMVDAISAEEGKIRKAQVLAWVKSRRILDADQRDRVEAAHDKAKRDHRSRGKRVKIRGGSR